MSIVRDNLMNREGYSPYCGNIKCGTCPRTNFNGKQFVCPCCKWESAFDEEFIAEYKSKWSYVEPKTKDVGMKVGMLSGASFGWYGHQIKVIEDLKALENIKEVVDCKPNLGKPDYTHFLTPEKKMNVVPQNGWSAGDYTQALARIERAPVSHSSITEYKPAVTERQKRLNKRKAKRLARKRSR